MTSIARTAPLGALPACLLLLAAAPLAAHDGGQSWTAGRVCAPGESESACCQSPVASIRASTGHGASCSCEVQPGGLLQCSASNAPTLP